MSFAIEIDADDLIAGLNDLDVELDVAFKAALHDSAMRVADEAKVLAPKVTGTLAASVHVIPPTGSWQANTLEGGVEVLAPYALPVHDGARPHRIYPRRASVLAWPVGRFATVVNHPGNRPNPFLVLAMEIRAADVENEFASAVDIAFERAGFGR